MLGKILLFKLKQLIKTSSIVHEFVPNTFCILILLGGFNRRHFLHRTSAFLSVLLMLLIQSLAGRLGAV